MQNRADNLRIKYAIVFAPLIYACTLNRIFCYIAFVLGVYVIFKCEFEVILPLFMFLMPMSTIFKPSAGAASYFTYLELLFVILYFIRNNFKIRKIEIGIFLFGFYIVIMQMLNGSFSATITIKMIVYLFLISIATYTCDENNYKAYFTMFISGLILSSFMGLIEIPWFHVHDFIVIKTDAVLGGSYNRFAGLYGDPNYYSINLIIAISLLIILYLKKEIKIQWCILISALLVYFAALTVSKSALLMLCFPALLLFCVFIKQKNIIGSVGVIFAVIIFVWMIIDNRIGIFSAVLNRLSNTNTDITSGRIELWRLFFDYFNENPLNVFFGRSVAYYTLDGHVAHNTYIDIIYELGIVGGSLLIFLLGGIVKSARTIYQNRRILINYSILAIIIIMYAFLSELQYFDPPFHLILAGLVLNLEMSTLASR